MLFCFSVRDTRQETNQFFYQFNTLETGLEFLNHVVRKGDTLTEIYLIEDGQRTTLSVDSFDGLPFLRTLRRMESEWKHRLTESIRIQRQVYQEESTWYRNRLRYYEQRIINLELMIDEVDRHYQSGSHSRISENQVIVTCYRSLAGRYRVQLGQSHFIRSRLLSWLYDPKFSVAV